jgi:hypothetical protein
MIVLSEWCIYPMIILSEWCIPPMIVSFLYIS